MERVDYTALYAENADFKAQNQRCRSLTALSGADGGQDVQGTDG